MNGLFTSLAVMLSPRGLAAAGYGAGEGGLVYLAVLAIAALVSISTARSMEKLESGQLRATPYDRFAFGLLDAGRFFTLTVLAVSWLGIAGHALNEIFFQWAPSLAASFVILLLAVWASFLSKKYAGDLFGGSLTLAFAFLIYVAVMVNQPVDPGMGYPTSLPELFTPLVPAGLSESGIAGWLDLVFLGMLAFIGFDLPMVFSGRASRVIPAVFLVLIGFALFGWAALLVESPAELVESAVPHLDVAAHVLDGKGILLMGGTVVLGTFAAVFAIFQLVGHRIKGVFAEDYSHLATGGAAVFMAVVLGILLGTGWADEQALESLIAAGICFWFSMYALIDLLAIIGARKAGRKGLFSFIALLLHLAVAGICSMHIEFMNYYLYALGGMAAAGIALGFGIKKLPEPELDETADDGDEDGEESSDGEAAEEVQEDEELNIVSYK